MFAYYLSGAYAVAAAAFHYGRGERRVMAAMGLLIRDVKASPTGRKTLLSSHNRQGDHDQVVHDRQLPGKIVPFADRQRVVATAARRRRSRKVNDGAFKALASALRLKTSKVDPSANYPDLFMTSEILDCTAP